MSTLFSKELQRWSGINAAQKADKEAIEKFKSIRNSIQGKDKAPTNIAWEYITLVLPQMVWKNPGLVVESSVPGEAAYDSIGLQFALQALMDDQKLACEWEQIFADSLAFRGVSMVTTELNYAPRFADGIKFLGWDGKEATLKSGQEVETPRMVRLDPTDFVVDPDALSPSRARFMGHCWDAYVEDLEELSEQGEAWNMDRILAISGDPGYASATNTERETLKVWEMFVPGKLDPIALDAHEGPEDPESPQYADLYNGTVYTMASGGEGGKDIRKPRLYRGPKCGPYGIYTGSPIPGVGTRMAPLMAVHHQITEATRMEKALVRAVDAYKRIVLTAFKEYEEAIKDAGNDGIVSLEISGQLLKDAIKEVVVGGPSKELIDSVSMARQNLDEALGLSQTKKGIATAGTTATAESIADKAGDMRLAMHREGVQRTACEQVWVMGWHVENSPDFMITLPPAALEKSMQSLGVQMDQGDGAVAVYQGGGSLHAFDPTTPGTAYDGKRIKFEPQSMERTSEGVQQRRAMQTLEAVQIISQMDPALPRDKIAEDHGRRLNIEGLGTYFKDTSAQEPQQQQMARMSPDGASLDGVRGGGQSQADNL